MTPPWRSCWCPVCTRSFLIRTGHFFFSSRSLLKVNLLPSHLLTFFMCTNKYPVGICLTFRMCKIFIQKFVIRLQSKSLLKRLPHGKSCCQCLKKKVLLIFNLYGNTSLSASENDCNDCIKNRVNHLES